MRRATRQEILGELLRWLADRPSVRPSEWARRNIVMPPSEQRGVGPLTWTGREFAIEPLDSIADPMISDVALCFGSQVGKTVIVMCGVAYIIANDPRGILWALPDITLARNFSKRRWMPLVEASKELKRHVPTGKKRHDWAALSQVLNGTEIDFIGSNSRSGMSSRPKAIVLLDEMDKFTIETAAGREAGAVELIEQRVKDQPSPKRIKTSTPSVVDGPGWVEFLKGDQRRYLVPCPHCAGSIFLAFIKGQSLLKSDPRDAHVTWDQDAKREDGSWDYDRVVRSAHWDCPHCRQPIMDHHKTGMVRGGAWVPTAEAPKTFRSYHLPSLYASSPGTVLGLLVQQYLTLQRSNEGTRGFINGALAEPYESQSDSDLRTEVVVTAPEGSIASRVVTLLTVDVQRSQPMLYWVAREWDADATGNSRRVGVGTCDSWAELDAVQKRHGVLDHHVMIDSGDGSKTEEIYTQCVQRGKILQARGSRSMHRGWIAAKGDRRGKRWKHEKTGELRPFTLSKQSFGGAQFDFYLLLFAGPDFLDMLAHLRRPHGTASVIWEVKADPDRDEIYWRHMDAKHRVKSGFNPRTGRSFSEWELRSPNRPDHWLDCEIEQLVLASLLKLYRWPGSVSSQKEEALLAK